MKKVFLAIAYLIIAASLYAASSFYFNYDFCHMMVKEDGPLENLTALVLLLISVLFAVRLFKQYGDRNKLWVAMSVVVAAGAFFGFGEEISWGQRIFSIQTGEFFSQHNFQGETNLHNLEVGGVNLNKLIFSTGLVVVFGAYFALVLLLYKKWSFFTRTIDLWGIPVPKIRYSIIIMLCTGVVLLIPERRIWELWEAIFVSVLLLVFLDPYNSKEELLP
ncbi:hypothetical protein SLH46_04380 [Draconibacterium sp. IB214405]|uniref:hypothetical protein n=1 Tax=Draconibacterium sp. IB214405 TaxID=3097352 RepID=UPI002A13B30C|nr:hypothetical protein [Draconibacterium sp. IB214405]MDX8338409.1 hypothetical protein [Draconibacterium sp. IB214405]